jgi:hypothetical protein
LWDENVGLGKQPQENAPGTCVRKIQPNRFLASVQRNVDGAKTGQCNCTKQTSPIALWGLNLEHASSLLRKELGR